MPGSQYFLANTFSHLLGGLIVTGISVENPLFSKLGEKPMTNFAFILTALPFLYFTYVSEPSPFKYLTFFVSCFILGQALTGLANRLEMEHELSTVFLNTAVLFATMSFLGVLDSQNALGWGIYLSISLVTLIICKALSYFSKTYKKRPLINVLLSYFVIGLFVLFVGFDVEVLKEHALKNINPDYINESMNLYLDFFNLFIGLGETK